MTEFERSKRRERDNRQRHCRHLVAAQVQVLQQREARLLEIDVIPQPTRCSVVSLCRTIVALKKPPTLLNSTCTMKSKIDIVHFVSFVFFFSLSQAYADPLPKMLLLISAIAAASALTFTGDVEVDFVGAAVVVKNDSLDVGLPPQFTYSMSGYRAAFDEKKK